MKVAPRELAAFMFHGFKLAGLKPDLTRVIDDYYAVTIDDEDVLTMITKRQPPPEPKLALIHRVVLDFIKARTEDEATTITEDAKKFNEE